MEATETKIIGKYKIEIIPDDNPQNPRTEYDNLGMMVCFSSRYSLGDKHDYRFHDYNSWDEMKKDIIKTEKVGVILPLYLYDHSGQTMNTTGFSCPFDSKQVGFIFISKKKMLEEYGGKIVTKKLKERVEGYLRNEVETFSQYLEGDCYGYRITDTETDEEVESCWGYYGEKSCLEEAEMIVKNMIE